MSSAKLRLQKTVDYLNVQGVVPESVVVGEAKHLDHFGQDGLVVAEECIGRVDDVKVVSARQIPVFAANIAEFVEHVAVERPPVVFEIAPVVFEAAFFVGLDVGVTGQVEIGQFAYLDLRQALVWLQMEL